MDHHGSARRCCGLLLLTLAAAGGLWAQDEGEWDPSGEFMKPRASAPSSSAPVDPTTQEAIGSASGSPALRPFVAKLAEAAAKAMAGDYASARSTAKESATAVAAVGVTSEFIKPRTVLAAAFTLFGGEMDAILGQSAAASRAFGMVKTMDAPAALKAQAAESEAYTAMLDFDFNQASSLERRARQQAREAIQPVMDAAASLYAGQAQQALAALQGSLGKGQNAEFAALYAAAAALALNRTSEASSYFSRPEASAAGYWPNYYFIGGLIDAASAGPGGAKLKFDEGARREHTRYRPNTILAAVAAIGAGQVEPGLAALRQWSGYAPPHFRGALVELLAQPSAAAATKALATPRIWLTAGGYRAGDLAVPAAESLPAMPVAVETVELPDQPEVAVSETGLDAGAPPSTTTTAAPTAAAPPATTTDEPQDAGVASINVTTQAASAYRSALQHIANHAYREAETTLDYAIRHEAFPEALLARGQLRYLRSEYRGAAADYARAAKLRPDWAEAVYSLAQATDRLGDPRRAAQYFRTALELGLPPALADYARSRAGG